MPRWTAPAMVLLSAFFAPVAPGQNPCATWEPLASGPSARRGHSMAYDAQRNVVVLFGGQVGDNPAGDTWEWSSGTWILRHPGGPGAPAPRIYAASAYDPRHGVVVFGGIGGPQYNDMWAWNGQQWTQLPSLPAPARHASAMAFDSGRNVIVLHGGFTDRWTSETWEYSETGWQPRGTWPGTERGFHQMTYDPNSGVTVLFGGSAGSGGLRDTWTWDGASWQSRCDPCAPPGRWGHAMTYDQDHRAVIIFGGRFYNDVWRWGGTDWLSITSLNAPPAARTEHGMIYASAVRKSVMFGGETASGGQSAETWALALVSVPRVTRQPVAQTVCDGGRAEFCVQAEGTPPLSYQWYRNGQPIPGATAECLVIDPVRPGDAGTYHVVVSNQCDSVPSDAVPLVVQVVPVITGQPVGQTVCEGRRVEFCVQASGTPPLSYQWYRNGQPIPGATAECLAIDPARPGDAGTYHAVVSNACGSVASDAVPLVVRVPPVIIGEPVDMTVGVGRLAIFCVDATGSEGFQWYRRFGSDWLPLQDGGNRRGSTERCLTINPAAASDAGDYRVEVRNSCGAVLSREARLTVLSCPGDVNGDGRVDQQDLGIVLANWARVCP